MNLYYGSMLLTVLANVGYHLSQRAISPKINPLLSLALTYVVALAATLAAMPFFGSTSGDGGASLVEQLKSANWGTYTLGLALVGLELGFLLVYRSGWKVSVAALVSNALVTILLVPVGVAFFRETLEPKKLVGIALASAGLWLMGSG